MFHQSPNVVRKKRRSENAWIHIIFLRLSLHLDYAIRPLVRSRSTRNAVVDVPSVVARRRGTSRDDGLPRCLTSHLHGMIIPLSSSGIHCINVRLPIVFEELRQLRRQAGEKDRWENGRKILKSKQARSPNTLFSFPRINGMASMTHSLI